MSLNEKSTTVAGSDSAPGPGLPSMPHYEPLDESLSEIRLIKIEPPETDDYYEILRCTMIRGSLQEFGTKYLAISYVWGFEVAPKPLVLNGHEMRITSNLSDFLLRYRKMSKVVSNWIFGNMFLWVDALCINQDDIPEKTSQVEMMGSIYQSARTAFCWLGSDLDDSKYAMERLFEVCQLIVNNYQNDDDPLSWVSGVRTDLWHQNVEKDSKPIGRRTYNRFWDGVSSLLHREYWTRAWIVQELLLSKNACIMCGQLIVPYNAFLMVFLWFMRIRGRERPPFINTYLWWMLTTMGGWRLMGWSHVRKMLRAMDLIKTVKESNESKLALVWKEFLCVTRIQQATDPRDKLYSVIGMIGRGLRADYSLSVERIYCDFAKWWATEENRLVFLNFSGHGMVQKDLEYPPHHLFVPSWAPNWDVLSKANEWGDLNDLGQGRHADGNVAGCSWTFEGDRLNARGVVCGRISTTQSLNRASPGPGWHEFCDMYLANRADQPYITGIPVLQALARTIMLDKDPATGKLLGPSTKPAAIIRTGVVGILSTGLWEPPTRRITCVNLANIRNLYEQFLGPIPQNESKQNETAINLHNIAEDISTSEIDFLAIRIKVAAIAFTSILFVTEEGYLGWGPPGMQTGDLVCVIFDCDTPVVLRTVDAQYIHVGECFAVGLMDGTAVSEVSGRSDQVQHFTIV